MQEHYALGRRWEGGEAAYLFGFTCAEMGQWQEAVQAADFVLGQAAQAGIGDPRARFLGAECRKAGENPRGRAADAPDQGMGGDALLAQASISERRRADRLEFAGGAGLPVGAGRELGAPDPRGGLVVFINRRADRAIGLSGFERRAPVKSNG